MVTSRERMLVALDGGRPDRLPATVHQWQEAHLARHMGGLTALEAFAACGLDAAIHLPAPGAGYWLDPAAIEAHNTPDWQDRVEVVDPDPDHRVHRHTVTTPAGVLTYATAGDGRTTWLTDHPLKRAEDLAPLRHLSVPRFDRQAARRAREAVGDRGILRTSVWGDQPGCWPHACCLVEPAELLLKAHDDPAWVHELLGLLLAKKLEYVEGLADAPVDLVETGGGAASSTLVSPALHEAFCLPYDKALHAALTDQGHRVVYHTCGGTKGIEGHILANGCTVSETLAPVSLGGNQEPWEYAAKVGHHRLALIGGLDQAGLLRHGTPAAVEAQVEHLFHTVGADGGYLVAPSDHFWEVPPTNLRAIARAARRCRY